MVFICDILEKTVKFPWKIKFCLFFFKSVGFNQKWLLALGMLNWKLKYMNKCSKVTLVKFKKKKNQTLIKWFKINVNYQTNIHC